MNRAPAKRRSLFGLLARRLERAQARRPIVLSRSDKEPTSHLDAGELDSFERLIDGLSQRGNEDDILRQAAELAYLSAPALAAFTPALIETCGRYGEQAGEIADFLAIFYIGGRANGPDGLRYAETLEKLIPDDAIGYVYLFLMIWERLFYRFDPSLTHGRDIRALCHAVHERVRTANNRAERPRGPW
ncbi:hypothetical protein HLH33_19100 [Gluconacetobacter diazotrophicus]|uniref:Uncharacterized protein n=1 Tax=Gluconacetobacter diazotrophicus TaxID=33996 RepID=A0A7W4NPR1_GLUDI|nr:hypothetical protein [Gluconacetobacter diazotrophicus]MBB2158370.1 hypothetical protein [Gluconacetobacter diazotrophicus]